MKSSTTTAPGMTVRERALRVIEEAGVKKHQSLAKFAFKALVEMKGVAVVYLAVSLVVALHVRVRTIIDSLVVASLAFFSLFALQAAVMMTETVAARVTIEGRCPHGASTVVNVRLMREFLSVSHYLLIDSIHAGGEARKATIYYKAPFRVLLHDLDEALQDVSCPVMTLAFMKAVHEIVELHLRNKKFKKNDERKKEKARNASWYSALMHVTERHLKGG